MKPHVYIIKVPNYGKALLAQEIARLVKKYNPINHICGVQVYHAYSTDFKVIFYYGENQC
tara:strand:+ start:153 stop:332 length:180 start_codon:yes stop_codon:yes gene_type:complete